MRFRSRASTRPSVPAGATPVGRPTPYRRAISASPDQQSLRRRARSGLVLALLRTGDFLSSHAEAAAHRGQSERRTRPGPDGDTWALGLFDRGTWTRAEERLGEARAHHGRARSLTARGRLTDALVEAQEAVKLAPREPEFHHAVGLIYERQHRYDEAVVVFGNYVNLLPNRDHSETATWTRAQIRFLDSFKGRAPVDFRSAPRPRGRCRSGSRRRRSSSA